MLFAAVVSVIFLTAPSARCEDKGEGAVAPKKEVSVADVAVYAAKGEWGTVASSYQAVPTDEVYDSVAALFAYAFHKTGNKAKAAELLKNRSGAGVEAVRVLVNSGDKNVKLPERDVAATLVEAVVVKKRRAKGSVSLGVLPKSVETSSVSKVFESVVPEPTEADRALYDEKVSRDISKFFLGGEVFYENDEVTFSLAFVDRGLLQALLGIKGNGAGGAKHKFVSVGVISRNGSEALRKSVVDSLNAAGYKAEDLGRGDFYAIGERADNVSVVVELNDSSVAKGEVLGSKLRNIEAALGVNVYGASSKKLIKELSERSSILHISEKQGGEAAVKKAFDMMADKLKGAVAMAAEEATTLGSGGPPLTVAIDFIEAFSSNYKYYASNPVGTVSVTNNTQKTFSSAKVSVSIKEYMDFSTNIDIGDISPGTKITKELKAVFSEKILDMTDDTFLQSEVKVTYYEGKKEQSYSTTAPLFVYEKHALVWDDKGKIASFITPKDPVVVTFAGDAASAYKDVALNKNIVKARAVFAAMGVAGITYMVDPNSPFEAVSGVTTVVDYVQFPRETLSRKAGDCDDLTSLYISALESLGIRTKLIDAPGHVFMMFSTGVPDTQASTLGISEGSYVIEDGHVWLPIETTLSGYSFTDAWKKGMENYGRWTGKLKTVDINEARSRYKAPNLVKSSLDLNIGKAEIEKKFPKELEALIAEKGSVRKREAEVVGADGLNALIQDSAAEGNVTKAVEYAKRLLKEPGLGAESYNNIGNAYYLSGDYGEAIKHYSKASELDAADAGVLANLARALFKNGEKDEAEKVFDKALEIDPGAKERYYGVYMELKK